MTIRSTKPIRLATMSNVHTGSASGIGLATIDCATQDILDVWYPAPTMAADPAGPADPADPATPGAQPELAAAVVDRPVAGTRTAVVHTHISSLAAPPADTADAYLRLHLLSARLALPRTLNLDGIFALLPNNAWTSLGPIPAARVDQVRLTAARAGIRLEVFGVDKFPRMTDYLVPTGVRIADADRVRLGAYLASGTTVMHEGFCNFNAGTLGASMVEGRISQGVIVGDGSDIGGGASIMGTLSGGGQQQISIGRGCLLGAQSGLGISLGDDCTVEAGLYLTAGTKLTLLAGEHRRSVKAVELSGVSGLLYRRNSITGQVEALPRSASWSGLNTALHAGQ